mgnify:CR=1 FL=1
MSSPANYLICYDISNPRRLRRVHHLVRDVGFPLQYSLFEAALKKDELANMVARLNKEIKDKEDRIHIFSLSKKIKPLCLGSAQYFEQAFYF